MFPATGSWCEYYPLLIIFFFIIGLYGHMMRLIYDLRWRRSTVMPVTMSQTRNTGCPVLVGDLSFRGLVDYALF